MQNFIGPLLSGESKEHAETHAINGTDPLAPDAIGAASEGYAEDLAQDALNASWARTDDVMASHLATPNPHQISPFLIGAAPASHSHQTLQNLSDFTSYLTSFPIGVTGNFVFSALNFFANQNTWTTIYSGLSLGRAKVVLIGCVVNNWEGGIGIMHGSKEVDLIGTTQAVIQYESVNLELRMQNGNLQVRAICAYTSGLLQFNGLMMYYGY